MAECTYCGGEMLSVTGCTHETLIINGEEMDRVPVGTDARNCHDCGAMNGEPHHLGCDMERCPNCGGQLLMHLPYGDCEEKRTGDLRCLE